MHDLYAGKREYSEGGRVKRGGSESVQLVFLRGLVKPRRPHHHPPACWQNLPVLCARGEVRTRESTLVLGFNNKYVQA